MKSYLVNLSFFSISYFLTDLFLFKSFENTGRYYFVTGMTCATLALVFTFLNRKIRASNEEKFGKKS